MRWSARAFIFELLDSEAVKIWIPGSDLLHFRVNPATRSLRIAGSRLFPYFPGYGGDKPQDSSFQERDHSIQKPLQSVTIALRPWHRPLVQKYYLLNTYTPISDNGSHRPPLPAILISIIGPRQGLNPPLALYSVSVPRDKYSTLRHILNPWPGL